MALKRLASQLHLNPGFCRFFSKPIQYELKVGIPEFLNGVGRGVETHVEKLESEIGNFQKLLVTRTLKLKKLGLPCKTHVRQELVTRLVPFKFLIRVDACASSALRSN